MPEFTVMATIPATPAKVWEVLGDPERGVEWMDAAVEREAVTPGPPRRGSVYRHIDRIMGRNLGFTWEITDYDIERRLAGHTLSGPFDIAYDLTIDLTDEGDTRVEIQVRTEAGLNGAFGKWADSIVAKRSAKQLAGDLSSLYRHIVAEANA